MRRIALIVEGKGDTSAARSLICRSAAEFGELFLVSDPPIRAGEAKKLKRNGELERYLELAATREIGSDREPIEEVFVLLDLDDGCAKTYAEEFNRRAKVVSDQYGKVIRICFCVREYETWFLADIGSIRNALPEYGISPEANFPFPENIRGAKEALSEACKQRKYKQTRDQNEFSRKINVRLLANKSRSFRKLLKEILSITYEQLNEKL